MLVSFSVRNFRTFRERAEWSLIASPDKTREDDNVVALPGFGLRLLKSAVVYGANASGKSKLIQAMMFMRWFVLVSSKDRQIGDPTTVDPFRLNPASAQAPSEFEIQFVHSKELYRYGFEVSATRVEAEWLFVRPEKEIRAKPEVELFYRTKQDFSFHSRQFGGIVGDLKKNKGIRENALLLSVAAQFNQPRAIAVLRWFTSLAILSGLSDVRYRGFTLSQLRKPGNKQDILGFLTHADLGIEDLLEGETLSNIEISEEDSGEKEEGGRPERRLDQQFTDLKTQHRAYTDSREPAESVEFSLWRNESAGTQKFLALTGPLLHAIANGAVLVADELDARLHPNLMCKIVHLFNSQTGNPNNAQLLFNTHDTNLLASGNFRRDQIWFTEKNRYGEASLYSLADFKTNQVRKDDNFETNYVRGKYGAVPYLGDFSALPKSASVPDPAPTNEQEK